MHPPLPGIKFHFTPCLMLFRTLIFLHAQQAIEIYMSAESQPQPRYLERLCEGRALGCVLPSFPLCSFPLEKEGPTPGHK